MTAQASLDVLSEAAERVQNGLPLPPALDDALHHGTAIGGARPKALIDDGGWTQQAMVSALTMLGVLGRHDAESDPGL